MIEGARQSADFVRRYLGDLKSVLDSMDPGCVAAAAEALRSAHARRRCIYVMGNGGSAAAATHLAADLGKNAARAGKERFRVMSLCENQSSITAYANDCGYETVFAEQLRAWLEPQDVLIAISASGNSANVIKAVELARERGATSIGITGFDGGKLRALVDVSVNVAKGNIEQVEDAHIVVVHLLVSLFKYGIMDL